jgi:AcrR family transcriptional regulator
MPRARAFVLSEALENAKAAFWQEGYEATAVSDLERTTGLNRSSLYLAFGSKRDIFGAVMETYIESFIDPLVGRMEVPSARVDEIASFFSGVKKALTSREAPRGCLMVNTIAELSGRDTGATSLGAAYRDRLRRAFSHALEGRGAKRRSKQERNIIEQRAAMLAATTMGIWLSACIDPVDAAHLCDLVTSQVESWGYR